MMLENEKRELVYWGRELLGRELVKGTGGNLSVIESSRTQVVLTPSAISYERMEPSDMVVCDLEGEVVEGRWRPSSEINIHLALYASRPDVGAVVHSHSIYATTLACLRLDLPPVHYLIGHAGARVPLAPYATVGTPALAQTVADTIGDANAVLLANHGLVAVGPDLESAFTTADAIEFVARMYYQALVIGEPKLLSQAEMAEVLEKFETYGQRPT